MLPDTLWKEIRECFEWNDGSLPGIEIRNLSPKGISAIYKMLRQRSLLVGEPPQFWSITEEASVLVDSVSNAASLVAQGEAEPFHHCIDIVMADGVKLPTLGVFVFGNLIELDYRMGPEWGPAQVAGFFQLLWDCCALDLAAIVMPAEFEGPPYPELFSRLWFAYKNEC